MCTITISEKRGHKFEEYMDRGYGKVRMEEREVRDIIIILISKLNETNKNMTCIYYLTGAWAQPI